MAKKINSRKKLTIILCIAVVIALSLTAISCSHQGKGSPSEDPGIDGSPATGEESVATANDPTAAGDAMENGKKVSEGAISTGDVQTKAIGFYADGTDSYYQLIKDALVALANQDPLTDWDVDYRVGRNTAEDQLKAVDDFIDAKYDAVIVIQNNSNTTSECIEKCKAAGIPYFGAAHYFGQVANAGDSAGSTNFDFKSCGVAAGEDALKNGVSKVVMMEGLLGAGRASDQTLGFLEAYEKAGKSLGKKEDGAKWTAEEIATQKPSAKDIKGKPALIVVQWLSVNWTPESAKEAMKNVISSLEKDGWNGAYVQNNPMAEGAILAMKEEGVSTDDYWLGSNNGRELSWAWAKDGVISMDVNQPPTIEGAILYQQLKAFFNGKAYRKHLHPYIIPYTKEDIALLSPSLVPINDIPNFIAKVNSDKIVWDIDDPKFTDAPGNW
jgi:ABC-type sugar transport system substrate-binding protein